VALHVLTSLEQVNVFPESAVRPIGDHVPHQNGIRVRVPDIFQQVDFQQHSFAILFIPGS
jgi:hypothetical protein